MTRRSRLFIVRDFAQRFQACGFPFQRGGIGKTACVLCHPTPADFPEDESADVHSVLLPVFRRNTAGDIRVSVGRRLR
ncbi:MAG: hypothetical protein ACP5RN_11775 [Armatimonadota bacterium]